MLERGALSPSRDLLLAGLVDEHIKLHGNDPGKSLAAVSSIGSVREQLTMIADPELHASLAHVSTARPDDDLYRTLTQPVLGESTSDGCRFRILRPHAKGGWARSPWPWTRSSTGRSRSRKSRTATPTSRYSRSRFVQEAEITGKLEHPGIMPVYGLGHDADGRPFYAMRFIQGDSLKEAIAAFQATRA